MLHLALALLAVAGSKTATVAEIDPFGPKGLRFATDDGAYSIKLGLLVQPQWTYTAAPGDDTNTFRVRRFELGFGGTFVSPRVKYKLKTAFDLPNRQGGVSARLLDASLEWMPIDELGFELGQYKVPFSYENLTTTGTNLLIDRSLADGDFGLDRDIGVTVKGRLFSGYLDYALYLINGDGPNNLNADLSVVGGARINVNLLGKAAYMQSDVEISESPILALGAAAAYDRNNPDVEGRLVHVTADAVFLWRGFSFLGVGHALINTTEETEDYGVVGQLGCFLWPSHLEVVGRGTGIFGRDEDTYEGTFGVNSYYLAHGLAFDVDYSVVVTSAEGEDEDEIAHVVRAQAQLLF